MKLILCVVFGGGGLRRVESACVRCGRPVVVGLMFMHGTNGHGTGRCVPSSLFMSHSESRVSLTKSDDIV